MEDSFVKTLKVSDKGQISIPNAIRKKFNISRGDDLVLFEIGGKIFLEKSENVRDKMVDGFKDVLLMSEGSLADVWDNLEDDVWGEYLNED